MLIREGCGEKTIDYFIIWLVASHRPHGTFFLPIFTPYLGLWGPLVIHFVPVHLPICVKIDHLCLPYNHQTSLLIPIDPQMSPLSPWKPLDVPLGPQITCPINCQRNHSVSEGQRIKKNFPIGWDTANEPTWWVHWENVFVEIFHRLPVRKITFSHLTNALNSGKRTPPESNRLFWVLKHSEKGRIFSTPSSHKQSSYFAKKKNGQKRPSQPSAVVWRKHYRIHWVTTTN